MTRATGWLGADEPDAQAPAMPASSFILAHRAAPGQGRTLEQALARAALAPDRGADEPEQPDPDERAAVLLSRGYSPGLISQLSLRLADVSAELQAEREALVQGAARSEQVSRMHQAGRITAWQIPQLLGDDLGDAGRVATLERQAESLKRQLDDAHEAMSPPRPQQLDGVEAASRRANELFRELTRARVAELEARQASRPAPRPFFAGRGLAVRSEVTCHECIVAGASPAESYLIHADPDGPVEAEMVDLSEQALAAFGRQDQAEAERRTYQHAEISR